eukprot:816295-Alexandrium_andersonii.AAC.1
MAPSRCPVGSPFEPQCHAPESAGSAPSLWHPGRRLGREIEVKRKTPTGKSVSVSVSFSCRACGRGEVAWAGERREPLLARARKSQMIPPGWPRLARGWPPVGHPLSAAG